MIASKKAVAVLSISAFAFLVAIILFYSYADKQRPGPDTRYFGETELDVFKVYIEGEKRLFYIDLAAKYSFDASGGAEALARDTNDFLMKFGSKFAQYVEKFDKLYNANLSISDYTFIVDSKGIKGVTNKKLNITRKGIDYSFSPNFRIESVNNIKTAVTLEGSEVKS